jgi:hypothetical protein
MDLQPKGLQSFSMINETISYEVQFILVLLFRSIWFLVIEYSGSAQPLCLLYGTHTI